MKDILELHIKNLQQGFTLIELLIAISIPAILLDVAVPSFVDMIQMNKDATRVQVN